MAQLKKFRNALMLSIIAVTGLHASWNFSIDSDFRFKLNEGNEKDFDIHALGASVRKTLSDKNGDRLILFTLLEAEENFHELMVHELYARYKGPLGAWNLTFGRFGLPYGLLYNFSTSRYLYESAYRKTIGIDADNGLMLSGIMGMLDYSLSVTQGLGAHHALEFPGLGLVTARTGFTFGDTEEYSFGVSAVAGKTQTAGHMESPIERMIAGIDATVQTGQFIIRFEGNGGFIDRRHFGAIFTNVDYALLPSIDLTAAMQYSKHGSADRDSWFAGLSFKPKWFTLRGGYTYAHFEKPHHSVSFQFYRLFSFTL